MAAETSLAETAKQTASKLDGAFLIDGQMSTRTEGARIESIDPSTEEVIGSQSELTAEDVDRAVQAANAAFEDRRWSGKEPKQREQFLRDMAQLFVKHRDELIALDVTDSGKPLWQAEAEFDVCVSCWNHYSGWPTKIDGRVPQQRPGLNTQVRREPIGVCASVIPWNAPNLMAVWKLAPALACGNSVVLKPAEQTPFGALRIGELLHEAGLPDGVANVITGGAETGAALVRHPGIHKIAFTGSVSAAKKIIEASANSLSPLTLELGGKSPSIVFEDADFERTVPGVLMGGFINSGQACAAGTRVLVHKSIAKPFTEALVGACPGFEVGPASEGKLLGPIISQDQKERVLSYVSVAKNEGAELLTGGLGIDRTGYFVEPTIFGNVAPDARIAQEEVFGPVLSIIEFEDEDDAIRIANNTPYGLSASVWTQQVDRAMRLTEEVRSGVVYVNTIHEIDETAPFGGFGASGLGREHGDAFINAYTEQKTVVFRYR